MGMMVLIVGSGGKGTTELIVGVGDAKLGGELGVDFDVDISVVRGVL